MSRLKGELVAQTKTALAVESLNPGDKVLIAESCTPYRTAEDIRWVKFHAGCAGRWEAI